MSPLSILAVDDEVPSLEELTYLLERCDLAGAVAAVTSATEALRQLRDGSFDVVLLDIRMPGLDGLELARILGRFSRPPSIVFISAHEEHALEAFDVGAVGYLLKPIDPGRLERALHRVLTEQQVAGDDDALEFLPLEGLGTTRIVARGDVTWVESAGDYVRVHTKEGGNHLLRLSMAVLEAQWVDHGFTRVHRSYLVAVREISELRTDETGTSIVVAGRSLPVSRRHLHELRDRLVRHVRPNVR